jgi:hypothetical protein
VSFVSISTVFFPISLGLVIFINYTLDTGTSAMDCYSEILMAQGTWRIQNCNELRGKGTAAVELSSHPTILKMGGVKASQNTVSNTPLAKSLV